MRCFWISLYVRLLKEGVGEGGRKTANQRAHAKEPENGLTGCVRVQKNSQNGVRIYQIAKYASYLLIVYYRLTSKNFPYR